MVVGKRVKLKMTGLSIVGSGKTDYVVHIIFRFVFVVLWDFLEISDGDNSMCFPGNIRRLLANNTVV